MFHVASFADIKLDDNTTTIVVKGKEAEVCWENRSSVILPSTPIFTSEQVEVHEGNSKFVYYRGIRSLELREPSLYTYNILSDCWLTEDRTLGSAYEVKLKLSHAIAKATYKPFLRDVLSKKASENRYEKELSNEDFKNAQPSKQFMDMCIELRQSGDLRDGFLQAMEHHAASMSGYYEYGYKTLNAVEKKILDEAIDIVADKYPGVRNLAYRFRNGTNDVSAFTHAGEMTVDYGVVAEGPRALAKQLLIGITTKFNRTTAIDCLTNFVLFGYMIEDEEAFEAHKVQPVTDEIPF